jgi:hypothetical protein
VIAVINYSKVLWFQCTLKVSTEESSYFYVRSYQMNSLQKQCKETQNSARFWVLTVVIEWYCVLSYDVARPNSYWDRTGAWLWYFCSHTSKITQCLWPQLWSLLKVPFNPLLVQFKSLLPRQKGCVFFSGHLNVRKYHYALVRLGRQAAFKSTKL